MRQKTDISFAKRVRIAACFGLLMAWMMGCVSSGHWENLPQPRAGVLAYMAQDDNQSVRRAVLIIRKLASARPLPVDMIYVYSSDYGNARAKARSFSSDNAGAFRCGSGNPPPHGCVYVGSSLLARLSDDALAGVLAHELGHLERGHKGVGQDLKTAADVTQSGMEVCNQPANDKATAIVGLVGCAFALGGIGSAAVVASYSRDLEREADDSGLARLAAADYCAGPVMKKTFAELARIAPGGSSPNMFSTHPTFVERWQNAGTDCGPLSPVGKIASPQRNDDTQKCYENKDDPDLAIRYCTQTIQSGQLSQESLAATFHSRGNAYFRKKDYDHAIQDYDEAIRLDANYGLAFYDRGNTYSRKGDDDRAIQDYDQAIRLNPNYALAFYNRGLVYALKRNYDRAIQDYDQAIRLDPNDALAFYERGLVYFNKRDYDRAIQNYDQAIRLNPNNTGAFDNRGVAYSRKGDYDRAIQDFDYVIQRSPKNSEAFNNRGFAYFRKEDYDRALQEYDQAIRLNPKYAEAFQNRGNTYFVKQDYDRAIQDYDQAIRLNPNLPQAFNNRASAYSHKGNYDHAVQDYDQAIRLNPNYAQAFSDKGQVLFNLGRFGEAQITFSKALELQPTNAYHVLLVYLTQTRAGQDGRGALATDAQRLELTTWPGQIVKFYLGSVTAKSVLESANNSDPKKDRGQHCDAYFYLGQHALITGNRAEAVKLFKSTLETGTATCFGYRSAQEELKRLSQ